MASKEEREKKTVSVTIILLVICLIWSLPTIGLLITSFRDRDVVSLTGWWTVFKEPEFTIENYKQVLAGKDYTYVDAEGTTITAGTANGKLIGGNLSVLCHLVGTPYLPSLEGCILFVEEKGEALYRMDRMLNHLRLSGQLKGLSAFVAGGFEECGDMAAIKDLLGDVLSGLEIPMVIGLPVGHGLQNMALPLGVPAELNADSKTLSLMEKAIT